MYDGSNEELFAIPSSQLTVISFFHFDCHGSGVIDHAVGLWSKFWKKEKKDDKKYLVSIALKWWISMATVYT